VQTQIEVAASLTEEREQTGVVASLTEEEETLREIQDWLDKIGQRQPPRLDPLVFWIFVIPFLPMLIDTLQDSRYGSMIHWDWSWLLISLLATVIPLKITACINRLRRETREDQQAELADVRWIGPLAEALYGPRRLFWLCHGHERWIGPSAEALYGPNARQRAAASRVLLRLLPRLKTADAGLLDASQQMNLCLKLRENRSRDMELNLAILKALERIGNEEALSAIEYVAESKVWLTRQRFVQQTAKICACRMEERLAESRAQLSAVSPSFTEKIRKARARARHLEAHKSNPEIDALKLRLKEEQKGRTSPGMRFPFLVASWVTLLPGSLWKIGEGLLHRNWLSAIAYGTVFGLTTQLPRLVLSFRQAAAAQKLAAFDNVQGIGPLAEALEWPDPAIRAMAAQSLTRLLPQLNASDAGLLNVTARGCLYRILRMGNARREEKLLFAILTALEQVGDEDALPYVRRLADGHAMTQVQKRVQRKAAGCLPYLESCADRRRGSQTLLRASSMDATRPEILLRPASGNTVTEPEQLLRAGIQGADNPFDPPGQVAHAIGRSSFSHAGRRTGG
jgi:hypothetical protein